MALMQKAKGEVCARPTLIVKLFHRHICHLIEIVVQLHSAFKAPACFVCSRRSSSAHFYNSHIKQIKIKADVKYIQNQYVLVCGGKGNFWSRTTSKYEKLLLKLVSLRIFI